MLDAHEAAGALLVLNGDTFDFLRITAYPKTRDDFPEWSAALAALGVARSSEQLAGQISSKERTFGLRTDDYKSVWKLGRIVRGHPRFVAALGRWVGRGGTILFVKGNHDLELHWPLVQAAIRDALTSAAVSAAEISARTLFCAGAFSVGNVYIEHGHRFEPITAVVGAATLPGRPMQLNLPVGSFVNRYLINPIERLEPFVDNVRPVTTLLWVVLRRHPLQALGILWRSWRFLLRALETRGALAGAGVVIYLAALVIPLVTAAIIVLAVSWPVVGQWVVDTFGRSRLLLGALGLVAPYIVGVLRDLFPPRRPKVGEDRFAAGAYGGLQAQGATRASGGSIQYAILGHTHEQDAQRLPPLNGAPVLYLNSGTWIPLWSEERPDLAGKVLHPVIRLSRGEQGQYTHEYLEWVDGAGPSDEAVILRRA